MSHERVTAVRMPLALLATALVLATCVLPAAQRRTQTVTGMEVEVKPSEQLLVV